MSAKLGNLDQFFVFALGGASGLDRGTRSITIGYEFGTEWKPSDVAFGCKLPEYQTFDCCRFFALFLPSSCFLAFMLQLCLGRWAVPCVGGLLELWTGPLFMRRWWVGGGSSGAFGCGVSRARSGAYSTLDLLIPNSPESRLATEFISAFSL